MKGVAAMCGMALALRHHPAAIERNKAEHRQAWPEERFAEAQPGEWRAAMEAVVDLGSASAEA